MKTRLVGTHRRRHRIVAALLAIVAGYLGAYVAYRQTHVEVWANDGKPYVIFDSMPAYYAFRPLSRIDAALTGTGAHIGPHR